jgi:23S rRNA (uracil747-C5)-methyltransferase
MKCDYYDSARCRSCSELPQAYTDQLARKQATAERALSGFAPDCWLAPVASPESGFRNKAKMAVGGTVAAPTLGLLDAAGNGVDLMHCPLYPASMQAAFAHIREALIAARVSPYDLGTRRGEAKYVLLTEAPGTGELLLRFVLRSREAVERLGKQVPALQAALPTLRVVSVNLLPEHKAVIEGDTEILLTADDSIRCRLNDIEFRLTPRAFLQTNSEVGAALYAQAREWIAARAPASVWDLYCGVGGFAQHAVAPGRRVIGVESTREAIAAARSSNSAIEWVCADASDWACAQTAVADCVIVNPPRRGIGQRLAGWLDQSSASTLVYSSCNIETLAADLAAMPNYRMVAARMFDMFPHTTHFETLVLLKQRTSAV